MENTFRTTLTPLELAVVDMLLAGDHPALAELRTQAAQLVVTRREFTGVGFFTDVARRVDQGGTTSGGPRLVIGDIHGTVPGVMHGVGFLLFIEDGEITMLEGFAYDDAWPDSTEGFVLTYWDDKRAELLASLDGEVPTER